MEHDVVVVIRLRVRTNDSVQAAAEAVVEALHEDPKGGPLTEYQKDGDTEWRWVRLEKAELVSSREASPEVKL